MSEEYYNDRVYVAKLLRSVRIGELSVKNAMLKFPKDTKDDSLIAAYHALIHYEADEDIRLKDELYKDEQDDYIEFIAYILSLGNDLPKNIIDNYKNFYSTGPSLHEKNLKGFFRGFWKNLNIKDN